MSIKGSKAPWPGMKHGFANQGEARAWRCVAQGQEVNRTTAGQGSSGYQLGRQGNEQADGAPTELRLPKTLKEPQPG